MRIMKIMLIAIFGKTPKLSLAELISLYGAKVKPIADSAALVDIDRQLDHDRLGGTIKLGQVMAEFPAADWTTTSARLRACARAHLNRDRKQVVGISVYGAEPTASVIRRIGRQLKQHLRSQGFSIRVVPNHQATLNSAQVLHNKLVQKGAEFIIVVTRHTTYIAATVSIQDIEAYAARDQARPARDARIGMLPPKLGQIMLNLAVGSLGHRHEKSLAAQRAIRTGRSSGLTILDPFCGTGVILQEALLAGYQASGSDISQRMVAYSRTNLQWLSTKYQLDPARWRLTAADATTHTWSQPIDAVVSETYLGPPLKTEPNVDQLAKLTSQAKQLIGSFLQNLANQIESGTPVVLALPVWRQGRQLISPQIDQMTRFGYNRNSFHPVEVDDMIYIRPQQFTGRQIIALERG